VDNLKLGGAIGGISGTLRSEGRGECCGYSEIFYMVAPRLCRLRTDGLVPVSSIEHTVKPSEGKGGESDVAILRFSMW
jgi:hypothetical protein